MIYNSEFPLDEIKKEKDLLFLAGSIDLELQGNWRELVTSKLHSCFDFFDPITLNHMSLTEKEWEMHILWELKAMDMSDLILINFLEDAKSPISLVELGLNTMNKKLVVVCPNKFYKSQYVRTLCMYYRTPIFCNLEDAITYIETEFR